MTTAAAKGLATCHVCLKLAPVHVHDCPRCGSAMHLRKSDSIQRTLALEPRHFGALSGLAMILEHVDRDKAALEAWREVARIFPGMERAREAVERLTEDVDGNEI